MSNKDKFIYESMKELWEESGKSVRIPFDLFKDLLGKAYDAGALESPDRDAARWRMFVSQFGEHHARFVKNVPFYPKAPTFNEFEASPTISYTHGAAWSFNCGWSEKTGRADTIPKFIDLMLAEHREEK